MLDNPLFLNLQASEDFNKAKKRATLSSLINSFAPERKELMSLEDVKRIVRPRGESYKGIMPVPISHIVGSEGRYHDFNNAFLPKREILRRNMSRTSSFTNPEQGMGTTRAKVITPESSKGRNEYKSNKAESKKIRSKSIKSENRSVNKRNIIKTRSVKESKNKKAKKK